MSFIYDKVDEDFDRIYSEHFGSEDIDDPLFASEIDAAFDAIYKESFKSTEDDKEYLLKLNFELVTMNQI